MTEIRTRQRRRLRSPTIGELLIEHTYIDQPASLDTWMDHCVILGREFGIPTLEVHNRLFVELPEIFGS